MSAPGGPPRAGNPPLLPRWFVFAVLPFLFALALTVAISAFVNSQHLPGPTSPSAAAAAIASVP
ncbi:MAG: hypothetical protein ACYCO3_12140 [Mycobacteriales bacterium]